MEHKRKAQLLASAGMVLIGFGLSLLGDTIERKSNGGTWFWRGTLSLSVINAGISVFGDAVKEQTLYEVAKRKEQRIKRKQQRTKKR
jgi:hypothetical protein